ncbi:hypothetical protein BGZ60DRAFT_349359, partial [Tricladium varicosporioides]
VFHVLLRIGECISSVIVLGLVSRVLYMVGLAEADTDSRLIYTTVVASISTGFSIVFGLPFLYAFLAFPVDFILFVTWLVAFCLMETVSYHVPARAGMYWHGPIDINFSGCSSWRCVLAFSFIASMTYLVNACL